MKHCMRQLIIAGLFLAATCFSSPAGARVERIEILSRQAFAAGTEFGHAGSYEKLRGRAFFALDPNAAANGPIADLKLATRNDRGLVEFSAEFLVLRPADVTRRNGALLYEVPASLMSNGACIGCRFSCRSFYSEHAVDWRGRFDTLAFEIQTSAIWHR